jgi:hypothetical protein
MPIGCLLCARDIQPFPPTMPNARGFERALLCRWHFREALDPEWFTMGAAAYWARLDKINQALAEQKMLALSFTPGYFSLLLEFESGVLLLYPQNESALFSYVPKKLLHSGRPSGLLAIRDNEIFSQKPALRALIDKSFASLQFGADAENLPDEKCLRLFLTDGTNLQIKATGWMAFGSNPEDVCDLEFS